MGPLPPKTNLAKPYPKPSWTPKARVQAPGETELATAFREVVGAEGAGAEDVMERLEEVASRVGGEGRVL